MKPISSDGRHSGPTDLILRSAPLGARLEGWPLERPRLWPSFETRAKSALLWTRLMNGVDMLRTSETLHEAMTHPADQRVARSPPRAQRKAEQQFPDCASPIQAADLSRLSVQGKTRSVFLAEGDLTRLRRGLPRGSRAAFLLLVPLGFRLLFFLGASHLTFRHGVPPLGWPCC